MGDVATRQSDASQLPKAEVRRGDRVAIQQVRVTFPPRHRSRAAKENFFRLAHSAEKVRTETDILLRGCRRFFGAPHR